MGSWALVMVGMGLCKIYDGMVHEKAYLEVREMFYLKVTVEIL